jgi:hypothetical protein
MSNSKEVKNMYVKIKDLSRPITKKLNLVLYLLDGMTYPNSFVTHLSYFPYIICILLLFYLLCLWM